MEHPSSSPPRHAPHPVIERFVAACAADARVAAAFLTGSYAAGTADAHSDLDLGVIIADAAYDDFLTSREPFVRLLGEPVFVETFGRPDTLFFILADGTEGELAVGRESAYREVANGPHWVLLDKTGVLEGAAFVGRHPDEDEQREELRRLVVWFWHDLSHFATAFARGQWWWAYGELETLRRSCVGLIRLRRDFADAEAASEPGLWATRRYFCVRPSRSANSTATTPWRQKPRQPPSASPPHCTTSACASASKMRRRAVSSPGLSPMRLVTISDR